MSTQAQGTSLCISMGTSILLSSNNRIQAVPIPVSIQSCSAVLSHLLGRAWPQLPSGPGRLCSSEQTQNIPSQSSLLHDSAEELEQTPAWGITAPKDLSRLLHPVQVSTRTSAPEGRFWSPRAGLMLHLKMHPFLTSHLKDIPDLQKPAASIQLLEICPVEGSAVQGSPLREHSLHVGSPGEFLVMHEEWDPISTGKGAQRKAVCCKLLVSYPCPLHKNVHLETKAATK